MKRNGPPFGSGPGAERKRAVGGLPFNPSAAGRATPPSSSASTQKSTASKRLVIVLKPRGRSRFDASFDGAKIVTASPQAISDAARVLHQLGFPDDVLLAARHAGADHLYAAPWASGVKCALVKTEDAPVLSDGNRFLRAR
jgi:hypothetical protein